MSASASKPWTEPELRALVEMSRSGMRLAAIALRLGRGYDSVRYMSRKVGADVNAIRKRVEEPSPSSPLRMRIYERDDTPGATWMRIVVATKRLDAQIEFASADHIPSRRTQAARLSVGAIGNSVMLELQSGLLISDSSAITEYLDNLDGEPLLTGRTPREKAIIYLMHRRAEILLLETVVEDAPASKNLTYFDDVLRERPFIAGDSFSMADISLLTGLAHATQARSAVPTLSALASWHTRVSQLPSVAPFLETTPT